MKKIYKYQLPTTPGRHYLNVHQLDKNGSFGFLSFAIQRESPVAWFVVDPNGKESKLEVDAFMTGQDFESGKGRTFMGTALLADGEFELHYFLVSP